MITRSELCSQKTRWTVFFTFSLGIYVLLFLISVPYAEAQATAADYASAGQTFGNSGAGAESALTGYGPDTSATAQCAAYPYSTVKPCVTWTFFGTSFATGICTGVGQCTATAVTPLGGIGLGVLTTALNIGINRAINGTSGSNIPRYTSGNPYGQTVCTGTRFISSVPSSNPCAVYLPTVSSGTNDVHLGGGGGSTTTVVTSGPATATLSVTPTSGPAPLAVTFTVTDTSTACAHPAIMISAGDGTDAVVAIPTTTSCTGRTPRTFTGTYRNAGTYRATIMSAATQQVLQTVTITVTGTGSATASSTSAFLSATPTSGPAPLSVTFTVADTSTSCAHPAILLSAGDGTDAVTAISETTTCGNRAPRSFNGVYRNAGTYRPSITNASTQQVLQTVTITVTGAASTTTTTADGTNATLEAEPTSGTAPLSVRFTVTDTSTSCARSGVSLSVTSGASPASALPAASACGEISPRSFDYTYRTAGTFRAEILNTRTNRVLQAVPITVRNANTSTPPLSTTHNTGSGSVDVSSSRLNLSGAGSAATAQTRTGTAAQPRTWGDIQANASGVTIFGGGHETDGRTGVAGFFGYNTIPGLQPKELAQKMCNERPWLSSAAAPIIPPSFFDSICTARGYKAGTSASASKATTQTASRTANAGTNTSASASSSARTVASKGAGPIEVLGPAKVYITAVPASVRIGSRTSIFWNAVGVKKCVERSPDGSFGANSLSGAASTVPITGETIYSIVCLKPDGSQVSNFVRVRIAN